MQPGLAESDLGWGTKLVKWQMAAGGGLTTAPGYVVHIMFGEWKGMVLKTDHQLTALPVSETYDQQFTSYASNIKLLANNTPLPNPLHQIHQITCKQCTSAQSTSSPALFTKWIRLCCLHTRFQIRKFSLYFPFSRHSDSLRYRASDEMTIGVMKACAK